MSLLFLIVVSSFDCDRFILFCAILSVLYVWLANTELYLCAVVSSLLDVCGVTCCLPVPLQSFPSCFGKKNVWNTLSQKLKRFWMHLLKESSELTKALHQLYNLLYFSSVCPTLLTRYVFLLSPSVPSSPSTFSSISADSLALLGSLSEQLKVPLQLILSSRLTQGSSSMQVCHSCRTQCVCVCVCKINTRHCLNLNFDHVTLWWRRRVEWFVFSCST